MKKFWNILIVVIFVNFLALPSVATFLDFEIPQTNLVLSEEENHPSSSFAIFEKAIPKTINIHDFIKFFETYQQKKVFAITDDFNHLSPFRSIFSPPPEA